jgi:uncharacterized glyoxalase superfamily protein PhnB
MTTEIQAIYLTTHNWGKAAKFYQSLGFTLEFETDHHSGQLRNASGPFLFIAEIPESQQPEACIVLKTENPDAVQLHAGVDVVAPFEKTDWGTEEMTLRDPDGRLLKIQVPVTK